MRLSQLLPDAILPDEEQLQDHYQDQWSFLQAAVHYQKYRHQFFCVHSFQFQELLQVLMLLPYC